MNLLKILALIAFPLAVLSTPLAAQAGERTKAADDGDRETLLIAGEHRKEDKGKEDRKDDDKDDEEDKDEKDGKNDSKNDRKKDGMGGY